MNKGAVMVAQMAGQCLDGLVDGVISVSLWTECMFSLSNDVSPLTPSQGQLAKAAEPEQGT